MVASTILSRKIVKPFSPTPSSLRHHNLSFMDCVVPPEYEPIVLFYSKPANYNISKISHILENSLSKVLASYYPFAGTIIDNKYVDCNDIGVEYLNVRINCPMSEILNHPYNNATDVVFPKDLPWSRMVLNGYLLVVQLSHFDCGGIAVSVCICHKIADGYSSCKFIDDWAATSRDADFKPSARFDASSFFPLIDDLPTLPSFTFEPHRSVARLFHFSSSSLNRLKDIVATSSGVHNPTRIEVASAHIHKCVSALSMANSNNVFKPSLLCHVMSLRPPLPLNTIGNACCHFSSVATTKNETKLHNFGAQLHKAKQQLRDTLKVMSTDQITTHELEIVKRGVEKLEKNTFDIYLCSSLCNFRLHKTNFGWGTPIRVTLASNRVKNSFYFFDDPNRDGINALVHLKEDDMLILQSNEEFLEFASPVVKAPE